MNIGESMRWIVMAVGISGLVFFCLGLWLGRRWERVVRQCQRNGNERGRERERKNGNGRGVPPGRPGGNMPPSRREGPAEIYVGNLSLDVTRDEIQREFGQFGRVLNIRLIAKRGEPKGFGFISMEKQEEAEQAIKALHGRELKGSPIEVNIARAPRGRRNHRRG